MKKDQHKEPAISASSQKIPMQQLIAYGFGGIIPIALFNIAGQLIGLMGNISLGLSALWLGVILIIPRLWDAISDPIVGHFSDNFRSRWGRRRPFLLIGGIAVAVSFVFMWWIPDGQWLHELFPTEAGFQWFQLGYILFWLLLFFTACTIFEIPHGALGMEMTTDPHERTRLFSAKSFLGNLFAMSTPWLFALANMEYFKGAGGNEADGMKYVSILVAAVLIPLSFWWFFGVKEPAFKNSSQQKKADFWKNMKHAIRNKTFIRLVVIVFTLAIGFNFVNLLGYYIPIFYVFEGDKEAASTLLGVNGTIWAITGLVAVFPLNWISPKIGKRKTLLIAIILMILAQLSKVVCYNQSYPYLVIVPTILLSAGMLFFFTLGSSMVGDICDEDDLRTGRRSEGSYYSIYWWFIKMGTAFASFVAGLLIVFTEFDENQVAKVDDFKGAVNELQVTTNDWNNKFHSVKNQPEQFLKQTQLLRQKTEKTLAAQTVYLEQEITKNKNQTAATAYATLQKLELYEALLSKTAILSYDIESSAKQLGSMQGADSAALQQIATSIQQTAIEADLLNIQLRGEQLQFHLQTILATSSNSQNHYAQLLQKNNTIKQHWRNMQQAAETMDIDHNIAAIKKELPALTQQSPYTLLMMRIVEIGLPILLCLVSILFVFRYPLTEARSNEIKIALEQRNK
ncbi:MAG: MFS transporter [Flavobacteriaceae bacterium]|nr:MFS transporter [Flavobacteriaceae bacterium]